MSDSKRGAAATDEIDQIMSEIEELQQEMSESVTAVASATDPSATSLRVIEGGAAEAPATPAPEDLMAEFKSSGEDVSLEGTLSDLDSSGPSSGNSLLDQVEINAEAELQALEAQVEAQVEASISETETTSDSETETEAEAETHSETQTDTDTATDHEAFEAATAEVEAEMKEHSEETDMPKSSHESHDSGTMEMTLQGNMTLKIRYQYEGQEVMVSFHDQALHVQLADGTEFKIPVARRTHLREVA